MPTVATVASSAATAVAPGQPSVTAPEASAGTATRSRSLAGSAGSTGSATVPAATRAITGTAPAAVTRTLATATLTFTPGPPTTTPSPTPVPTLSAPPRTMLENGRYQQSVGDCATARRELAELLVGQPAPGHEPLPAHDRAEAQYRLAQCYMRDSAYQEAGRVLRELLLAAPAGDSWRAPATFLLAETQSALNEWADAETSYVAYAEVVPELRALAWQRVGGARSATRDYIGATQAYTTALALSPDWNTTVSLRRSLADLALKRGDGRAAAAQYDLLRGENTTGAWAAEMQWLAGTALERAGDAAGAQERWRAAVDAAVTTTYAHSAMAALVDAGVQVDEFQRGLVNYHTGRYDLAIAAFERYRAVDAAGRQGQAWYYTALSHLSAGRPADALAELGNFIAAYPQSPLWADAWLYKARAQARTGDVEAAIDTYLELVETKPDVPQAPRALWLAGNLQEDEGRLSDAAATYTALARRYPAAEDGWRGFLWSGLTRFLQRDWRGAAGAWTEMASSVAVGSWSRPVAYYWLGRAHWAAGEREAAQTAWRKAWEAGPATYYGLRAAAWSADSGKRLAPAYNPKASAARDREELANWLAGWAGEGQLDVSAKLAADPDWRRGVLLAQLGLRPQALAAWNAVLSRHAGSPWTLAGLSIAFSDAGAPELSIRSAEQVAARSPGGRIDLAPVALQRLAYPLGMEGLLRENAAKYGLDPRLVAAVIRQESRFETGARSVAAAQGLMQIIPDTATWIAQQLRRTEFRAEQIYWPYVNVEFGSYYLQQQLKAFDNSLVSALAAYNGGPGNASRWRKRAPGDDDLMVGLMDITETRLYVQLVSEHFEMYARLYPR